MKQKLVKLLKRVRARFSSPLPVGMTEFESWADSFEELYDLPTKDKESIKVVLSSTIINLGSITISKPKYHFYKTLVAASAKQVAGSVFQQIQQAKFAADKVAKRDAQFANAKEVTNVAAT